MSGDAEAVAALKQLAMEKVGEIVGIPCYQETTYHHLKSPLSTRMLLIPILDEVTLEGDVPFIPEGI